jgi:alpha,alpha-trehalose phosphorylase
VPDRGDGMPHFDYDAVLFDLDGVLTSTTPLHAACWKQAFDEFLTEPFDAERDYLAYVDGKPRHEGVRDLLLSRGIDPAPELVSAIADRKQTLVARALETGGVDAFPGSVRWVEQLRDAGVCTAVVSASANCAAVLRAAGIERRAAVRRQGRRRRR